MNDARLEVRLPHERREQLDRMAEATGLTARTGAVGDRALDRGRLRAAKAAAGRAAPMTAEQEQTWGELRPAMRVLGARQQAFVRALILEKPGYGAVTRAYRKAGYGPTSKAATQSKEAHKIAATSGSLLLLPRNPRRSCGSATVRLWQRSST